MRVWDRAKRRNTYRLEKLKQDCARDFGFNPRFTTIWDIIRNEKNSIRIACAREYNLPLNSSWAEIHAKASEPILRIKRRIINNLPFLMRKLLAA